MTKQIEFESLQFFFVFHPRSQQKKGAVLVDCVHRNHCLCWKSELPVAWKESCFELLFIPNPSSEVTHGMPWRSDVLNSDLETCPDFCSEHAKGTSDLRDCPLAFAGIRNVFLISWRKQVE